MPPYLDFNPIHRPTSTRFLRYLDRKADALEAEKTKINSPEVIRALSEEFKTIWAHEHGGEG